MAKKKVDGGKIQTESNFTDKATEIVLKDLKKKYGAGVIGKLSETADNIKTVSTGSLSLDLALGRGGMALGRVYEVFGPNSSGKSTLGVHVIIQAQRRGMRCAYLDVEQAVDPKLFESYGINSDELDLVQIYGGEPNLDILDSLVKTGSYGVIVIDSVSALIPTAEAEADIEKDHMALQARLMSKAMRKITPQAAINETLLIFVNQVRMKVGAYGNPETTSGGVALPFSCTGRISIRGPEAKSRRLIGVTGETYGHIAEHEVVKNKLGEPFRRANLNLIYGKGYDFVNEVLELATSLDIIEKNGSWFKYNDANIAQGAANVLERLKDDKEFFAEIRNKVIDLVGLKEQYELHSNPGPIYTT